MIFLKHMYNHRQRLMRWALLAQEYNLDFRHKRGVDNVIVDALSGCSVNLPDEHGGMC